QVLQPNVAKRFFRNPDERILGGVAGGIAAYFKWDVWIVRLVFVAPFLLNILLGVLNAFFNVGHHAFPDFFFGSLTGTSFLTYIVLWIILPMAVSPFEKMEMRGENVDVHRIRENVKTNTQAFAEEVKNSAKEFGARASSFASTRGKTFATEVGQAARPLATGAGHVIATILKLIVLFFAGFMALAFFGTIIALVFTGFGDFLNNFVLEGRFQKVMGWGGVLLLFGVPFVALVTWLVRRLMKVRSSNRYIGWVFGGLWLIGILMSVAFAASMARSFQYTGRMRENVETATVRNKMTVRVVEPPIEYSGYYSFMPHDENEGFDVNADSMKLSAVRLLVDSAHPGARRQEAALRRKRWRTPPPAPDAYGSAGRPPLAPQPGERLG
ncbi:MAG: PspC domain-containing protein, partial [Chitinophagaceae bacterium]